MTTKKTFSREGIVYFDASFGNRRVEVFRFIVGEDGEVALGKVDTPLPVAKPPPKVKVAQIKMVAMKAKKASKRTNTMKVMKKTKAVKKVPKVMKRATTVAKGKKARLQVWIGKKTKTVGGLRKEQLVKSRKGKIVPKSRSEKGRASKWSKATKMAYQSKGYSGFKPIKKGTSFYERAKEVLKDM